MLLHTNVVSAVMATDPEPTVLEWLRGRDAESVFLSSITIAEIRLGLEILPDGRRRRNLETGFGRFLERGFARRILPFDEEEAWIYGELMARCRSAGRRMSMADGQIAAIARSHGLAVATRNVRDFEACGVELVNPFEPG